MSEGASHFLPSLHLQETPDEYLTDRHAPPPGFSRHPTSIDRDRRHQDHVVLEGRSPPSTHVLVSAIQASARLASGLRSTWDVGIIQRQRGGHTAPPLLHDQTLGVSHELDLAIVKKRLKLSTTLYEMLQILSLTMFERIPLDHLLARAVFEDIDPVSDKHLILFK